MRILLTTLNAKYIHLNLAIRLLYDLNNDVEGLSWKEFTIKENKDDIAAYCKDFDIVCFSCYIWNITPTLEVAKKIKNIHPNIKILLGGPEVSYDWQGVIELPQVDYIIVGEGEIPFSAFIRNYPTINELPNIVSKDEFGKVQYKEQPENFNIQLYSNRNPYQYDPDEDLKNKVLYIETSRGCPYKCEFCLASLDNKVRYLPMDTIKQQLLYLFKRGNTIKFLDRTFNIKKDFTLEIFKFILDHRKPGNVFQFEITADILHPEIITFIQTHIPPGLLRFEIGIQTVNQKANLAVSRKQHFEKTVSIIRQVEDFVELHLDLIVGLPLDYFEDIKYSFEAVFKLFAPELQLGFLKFLKGTPVREKYTQYDYVFDPLPPYQIIQSKFLSKEELKAITHTEHALEIYWNKKRCINSLKYITKYHSIFDFLQGLGAYFEEVKGNAQYSLIEIYQIIFDFTKANYPSDSRLLQLIAIDYYLQNKTKPGNLFIQEMDREEKGILLQQKRFNQHKYRYTAVRLDFNLAVFIKSNDIVAVEQEVLVQYDGINKPELFFL
ncbi:MAG: B12-binding domain-containing radical SAM protein [Chitinophagales bacterium]|nr:B12-binding domain-containing radical SAM protein [Chitinophagales bacterium]